MNIKKKPVLIVIQRAYKCVSGDNSVPTQCNALLNLARINLRDKSKNLECFSCDKTDSTPNRLPQSSERVVCVPKNKNVNQIDRL